MPHKRTKSKPKPKTRGDTRFPGICRHARELGVNRVTLFRTLTGAWHLPGLKGRYEELVQKESA
jgi:hypothetical protein